MNIEPSSGKKGLKKNKIKLKTNFFLWISKMMQIFLKFNYAKREKYDQLRKKYKESKMAAVSSDLVTFKSFPNKIILFSIISLLELASDDW